VEKNENLPDASGRERLILIVASLVILFMGIFSPLFTHRMDATTNDLLQQVNARKGYDVQKRAPASRGLHAALPSAHELAMRTVTLERRTQP
jgi:hypothetical protein